MAVMVLLLFVVVVVVVGLLVAVGGGVDARTKTEWRPVQQEQQPQEQQPLCRERTAWTPVAGGATATTAAAGDKETKTQWRSLGAVEEGARPRRSLAEEMWGDAKDEPNPEKTLDPAKLSLGERFKMLPEDLKLFRNALRREEDKGAKDILERMKYIKGQTETTVLFDNIWKEGHENQIVKERLAEFLKKEFSLENLDFLDALKQYQKRKDEVGDAFVNDLELQVQALEIYKRFVTGETAVEGQEVLNLSFKTRTQVEGAFKAMSPEKVDLTEIDAALKKAGYDTYHLLKSDSFTRFKFDKDTGGNVLTQASKEAMHEYHHRLTHAAKDANSDEAFSAQRHLTEVMRENLGEGSSF